MATVMAWCWNSPSFEAADQRSERRQAAARESVGPPTGSRPQIGWAAAGQCATVLSATHWAKAVQHGIIANSGLLSSCPGQVIQRRAAVQHSFIADYGLLSRHEQMRTIDSSLLSRPGDAEKSGEFVPRKIHGAAVQHGIATDSSLLSRHEQMRTAVEHGIAACSDSSLLSRPGDAQKTFIEFKSAISKGCWQGLGGREKAGIRGQERRQGLGAGEKKGAERRKGAGEKEGGRREGREKRMEGREGRGCRTREDRREVRRAEKKWRRAE
ncbi:hypothetical protein Bbelb_259090 [Branchiostoma belcheri]|nr:hypothetical protein Bbelb_259090 [Branchiostoma belcheri]